MLAKRMYLSKNITGVGDYNCILRSWWEKVKPLAYISATEAPAEAFRTKAALIVNVGGGRYVFFLLALPRTVGPNCKNPPKIIFKTS